MGCAGSNGATSNSASPGFRTQLRVISLGCRSRSTPTTCKLQLLSLIAFQCGICSVFVVKRATPFSQPAERDPFEAARAEAAAREADGACFRSAMHLLQQGTAGGPGHPRRLRSTHLRERTGLLEAMLLHAKHEGGSRGPLRLVAGHRLPCESFLRSPFDISSLPFPPHRLLSHSHPHRT